MKGEQKNQGWTMEMGGIIVPFIYMQQCLYCWCKEHIPLRDKGGNIYNYTETIELSSSFVQT